MKTKQTIALFAALFIAGAFTSCGTSVYFGQDGIELVPPPEPIVIPTK